MPGGNNDSVVCQLTRMPAWGSPATEAAHRNVGEHCVVRLVRIDLVPQLQWEGGNSVASSFIRTCVQPPIPL